MDSSTSTCTNLDVVRWTQTAPRARHIVMCASAHFLVPGWTLAISPPTVRSSSTKRRAPFGGGKTRRDTAVHERRGRRRRADGAGQKSFFSNDGGVARNSRRRTTLSVDASGETPPPPPARTDVEARRRYVNVTGFPFPLTPLLSRRTALREVVPGLVWTLEQEQGIGLGLGVSTNVRMTVVKMEDGRLWVHDPIAPTQECVDMAGGGAVPLRASSRGTA